METSKSKKSNNNFLKQAYNIYSNKFKSVLILTLLFYVPFYIIFFISSIVTMEYYPNSIDFAGISIAEADIILNLVILVLNIIFSPLFMGSMYFLVKQFLNIEEINYKIIFKKTMKISHYIIFASLLYYALIFLSLPVFIVMPYVMTVFYFHTFSVCEGHKNPINAIKYSFKIVKNNFFMTFLIIILTSILSSFVTEILFGIITISKMPNNIVVSMFYNLFATLLNSYFYIFLALWCINRMGEIEQNKGAWNVSVRRK